MDSAALYRLNEQQSYLFGQVLTRQTGGQLYSDTSPHGKCSMVEALFNSLTVLVGKGTREKRIIGWSDNSPFD